MPPSKPQPGLAAAIREFRGKRGWSQEDLAHRAGITTGALSAIERGKSNPTWGTVRAIAEALELSIGQLASRADKLERT